MKKAPLLLILFACISCSKVSTETIYYKSIPNKKNETASVKIIYHNNSFYGDFTIEYFDKTKESGTIQGTIYGDTLKGKFKYISRSNIENIKPIAFLKLKDELILGEGSVVTYMQIPYYLDGSITFNDSLQRFKKYSP